jgi:hypothetical protein
MIYVLTATVFAGAAVTALLSARMVEGWMIASAAIAGAVVALPVAWLIGKQIYTAFDRKA